MTRDIRRKMKMLSPVLEKLLSISDKVLSQERSSKNKGYSTHEAEVECISKGKPRKKYEFGCKVGFVTSATSNWILGAKAFHGNPYDGHTLKASLEQAHRITRVEFEQATCDMGYRKHEQGQMHRSNSQQVSRKGTKSNQEMVEITVCYRTGNRPYEK